MSFHFTASESVAIAFAVAVVVTIAVILGRWLYVSISRGSIHIETRPTEAKPCRKRKKRTLKDSAKTQQNDRAGASPSEERS